jgi:hypothetical protein
VWSRQFGFGQVIVGGDPPFVRWLDGLEGHVAAADVQPMSEAEYDGQVFRRMRAERWITECAYGADFAEGTEEPWVRDDDGFWILTSRRRSSVDPTRTVPRPDMSDIDGCVESGRPASVPPGATVVRCNVTRYVR